MIGIISTLSGIIVPNSLNWIRSEKVNSYARQLREYFRLVRLQARRWGTNCYISTNTIGYNSVPRDKDFYGYSVTCEKVDNKSTSKDLPSRIGSVIPPINNSIFQVVSKDDEVEIEVPINLTGESPAVKNFGGILIKLLETKFNLSNPALKSEPSSFEES